MTTEKHTKELLESLGYDLTDPNFVETPQRIAKMYKELLVGDHVDLDQEVKNLLSKVFPSDYDGIIVEDNISAWGVCPHHFLPINYTVHVGYIPKDQVFGLSKIPRLVKLLAARAVMQEQFTNELVNHIVQYPNVRGVIAIVKAQHYCMRIRGVKAEKSITTTSEVRGIFAHEVSAKQEFLNLIRS